MKTTGAVKHHKTHKYTLSGFAFGGVLLLISMANMFMLEEPKFHPLSVYITLIPGILFILRSLRPPMGILRGITTYLGGTLAGMLPMAMTSDNTQIVWLSLAGALLGAALLGVGFTPKPRKEEHVT